VNAYNDRNYVLASSGVYGTVREIEHLPIDEYWTSVETFERNNRERGER